jgi:hypothetical protein
MIASVHIADVGVRTAIGLQRRSPKPARTPGLRWASTALAAPISPKVLPGVQVSRVALLAFWDDDAALDRFLAESAVARSLDGGWRARLEPLRAFGSWPGLDDAIPRARRVDHDGPVLVFTLGRLRLTQAPRFLRASARAQRSALAGDGLQWGTAMARPPFVATCTQWASSDAVASYAYGTADLGHPDAITTDRTKPFHHESAFIRFRICETFGGLSGRNPIP